MGIRIATQALYILYKLKAAGYTSFLVGGAVRDLLAEDLGIYQRETRLGVADYDLTTVARPEEIQAVFPESFYENTFGTVSVAPVHLIAQMGADSVSLNSDFRSDAQSRTARLEKNVPHRTLSTAAGIFCASERNSSVNQDATNIVRNDRININNIEKLHDSLDLPMYPREEKAPPNFEITTFRDGESYENDARHPSSFSWGETIEEDLARRDFTVNGLALDIAGDWLATVFTQQNQLPEVLEVPSENYKIIDEYGGLTDLKNNIIRTIGEPVVRFREDALRLMRAVRLSVQLNFAIEENTYQAIAENHPLISKISFERISGELLKMLASDFPKEAILILDDTGLLKYILPELEEMKMVAQSGHHLTDVWQHSLDALASCPSHDPLVRLATLLHDVGKPQTRAGRENAYTFYNHEIVGARVAKQIGRRLRLSSHDLNRLFILVRFHMFHYQPQNTDASIRRFMRNVGLENLNDILDVREADRLGSSAKKTSWRLEEMKQRMIGQLHQPLAVRDLAINGYDLMKEFNLQPGKILGEINDYLLELVLDNTELNTREKLLEQAKEFLANRAAV